MAASAPSRLGRPSREEQLRRQDALLEAALDVFLERGFDATSVEEIAGRVGMSKRTVYARHADKAALFRAAVTRAIERSTLPRSALEAVLDDDLEASLLAFARLRIANLETPHAMRLQRILASQAYRFPDLFNLSFAEGSGPALAVLTDLFARHVARGEMAPCDPHRTGIAFLTLVVGGPARMIAAGLPPDGAELEARVRFAVRLFLDGVRTRPDGGAPATTAG